MNRDEADDEINLEEVLSRLWAYKSLFVATILIFVSYSIFYIINSQKVYTSSSIFIPAIENSTNDLATNFLSRLSNGAQFAGMPTSSSNVQTLIERFTGREFVLEVASELKLSADQFFNSYDPKIQEPFWKAKLKSLINWTSSSSNPAKIAEWNVLQNFKNYIIIEETNAGAIEISVDHFNPERAAEIANHIMTKIISVINAEKFKSSNDRLEYLSQRLADSLIKFENAEENLKQFLLLNSTAASASFYRGSIILDRLRTQREDSNKQIDTIDVLLSYVESSPPTFEDYAALRKKHPLLDQTDFRRILGISETISAWSWPSVGTLKGVRDSLVDRADSLNAEIRKYENEAVKYASRAEKQNKLTRELKIAETVYKVLLEQVKSQSLIAGFTPDTSRIIAAADAAIVVTKPKKMVILALALVSGFLVFVLFALILSWNKGIVYSSRELLRVINPKFYHKIHTLKYYRASNLQEVRDRLIQQPAPWLKQLFMEICASQRTSPIVVADITKFHVASTIARLLAARAHEFGMSVAYFDLSKTLQIQDNKKDDQVSKIKTDIEVAEIINGCTEYNYRSGKQNVDWLFSKSFQETLDFLNTKYDTIIFSTNLDVLDILQTSGKLHEAKLVIHASKGKTTYKNIKKLNINGNIEVALLS